MTLIQLFTAIADAIRSKKGTSATIAAENFPSEIESISGGSLIKFFIQDDQPNGYDGIWIADSTYANYPIVEVADSSSLVANSINIVKGHIYNTKILEDFSYSFNAVYVTDNNSEIIKIDKYCGNSNSWIQIEDYVLIQYIQSTGSQYINTLINPNGNMQYDLKMTDILASGVLFGAYNSSWVDGSGLYTSMTDKTYDWFHYYENYRTSQKSEANEIININKGVFIVNGSQKYDAGSKAFIVNKPLYIFAGNMGGALEQPTICSLHYFKIYDGETLVRDFVPVKNQQGVACLYDKVSQTLFYNEGSGSFIAGPEA